MHRVPSSTGLFPPRLHFFLNCRSQFIIRERRAMAEVVAHVNQILRRYAVEARGQEQIHDRLVAGEKPVADRPAGNGAAGQKYLDDLPARPPETDVARMHVAEWDVRIVAPGGVFDWREVGGGVPAVQIGAGVNPLAETVDVRAI